MSFARVSIVYRPLYYFTAYIVFTLFLAIFGPVEYRNFDILVVLIYISAFLVLFALGYFMGVNSKQNTCIYKLEGDKLKRILTILKWCIVIGFGFKFSELILLLLGGGNISLEGAGDAYKATYEGYERGQGDKSASFILSIFISLPLYVAMILGIYYFDRLNFRYKTMLIMIFVLFLLVNAFGQGKQKQLGDIGIIIFTVLSLKTARMSDSRQKKRVKSWMLGVLFAGFSLLLYIWVLRYASNNVDLSNINDVIHPSVYFNSTDSIFSFLPEGMQFSLTVFSFYLTQGYYGLSLALNMDFVWTYFIGGSYTTMALANQVFGAPLLLVDTYPYRAGLEFGWGMDKWHSVFPWLASDMTFPGVLVFFAIFAYVYGVAWIESYRFSNPISIVLLSVMTIGLVYVPANNQLFHNPGAFFTIFVLMIIWITKRKKYNFSSS